MFVFICVATVLSLAFISAIGFLRDGLLGLSRALKSVITLPVMSVMPASSMLAMAAAAPSETKRQRTIFGTPVSEPSVSNESPSDESNPSVLDEFDYSVYEAPAYIRKAEAELAALRAAAKRVKRKSKTKQD